MLRLFFIFCSLLAYLFSYSQKIEKFYDIKWQECNEEKARFYSITQKTDSGWLTNDYYIKEKKLQMRGLYADEQLKIKNGHFLYFHSNGNAESLGKYVNDIQDGLWLDFDREGMMTDSTFYKNGRPFGVALSWHSNGYLKDSISVDSNGRGIEVSWFDNGNPSYVGKYSAGMKREGLWVFFHKNGQVSSKEKYVQGKLIHKNFFDEVGNVVADTTNPTKDASYVGGKKEWIEFIHKNLYFPEQYKIQNYDEAIVVVDFIVSEEGNIESVFTSGPLHPAFDKIAEDAIKKSKKWIPAVDEHNRKVKYYLRQPVTFQQIGF